MCRKYTKKQQGQKGGLIEVDKNRKIAEKANFCFV